MKPYEPQHYYRYDEMAELLRGWADACPETMTLGSIGTSYEGREIPLVTLTRGGGEKPALLLTGNLHSSELIGSCAVLYAIDRLLRGGEDDARLRGLLETHVVYCIPRVNVDGAEGNLTQQQFFRGSKLPFHAEEDGVVPADIDGDGVIRRMRIPNPAGDWVRSAFDGRVMCRLWPGMERPEGAVFYDVVDEGYVRGAAETPVRQARSPYDIDPNRSFPYDWDVNALAYTERPGAGDYPLMDCETRALARFVLAHPEITMAVDMHSNMGAYISPIEFCQDHDYDARDKAIFDALGARGTERTGYISSGIFPPEVRGMARGSYTTWLYFVLGIPAWCQEIGSTRRLYGGVDAAHPLTAIEDLRTEEEIVLHQQALMRWDREKNGGRGYTDWHPFRHPQLGEVEIGGWDEKFVIWNLPGAYVEQECAQAFDFTVMNFLAAGYVRLGGARADGSVIRVELENEGRFPSTKTYQALPLGAADGGMLTLTGIRGGKRTVLQRMKLPVLDGGERRTLELACPAGCGSLRVTVDGPCAGRQSCAVE